MNGSHCETFRRTLLANELDLNVCIIACVVFQKKHSTDKISNLVSLQKSDLNNNVNTNELNALIKIRRANKIYYPIHANIK